ncbi:putative secreted protein [Corynebacterium jeikeium]|uniref:DUF3152 domain-containing protein n=1 Tax=Corynebacterium jeikeium (strain K411) TaxID=306537 RepID=Q4JTR9_CORJK|nr:DUF3152 domain-containing protein [Corynebacterium jeikeium]CAI37788.1 conserved hypothetical protein [Corynebacterium jeikeium K411]SUY84871.1 putative secreted protein [Corynebacterium jeikeium]
MSSGSNVERHPIPPARKLAPRATEEEVREPQRGRFSFRSVVLITAAFVLVTLLVMYSILHGLGDEEDTQATGEVAVTSSDDGGVASAEDGDYEGLEFGSLPPGGKYTKKGSGKFRTVGEPGKTFGKGKKKFTYVVEVETTLKSSAYGGDDAFAAMVDATLANPKSWVGDPQYSFQHVDEKKLPKGKEPDMRIQLTSPETTAATCGDSYGIETSCNYPGERRVVLNEARWVRGAIPFEGDLGAYRQYMINHEVGHGIGHKAHVPCSKDGALAPIMMQQTISLNNAEIYKINPDKAFKGNSNTCKVNPWVFPFGYKDSK